MKKRRNCEATTHHVQRQAYCLISLFFLMPFIGCDGTPQAEITEAWATRLHLESIEPRKVLPSTTVLLRGAGFVSRVLGTSRVRFRGTTTTSETKAYPVDVRAFAEVDSPAQIRIELTPSTFEQLCPSGMGQFAGIVELEVASIQTNIIHRPTPLEATLDCTRSLKPTLIALPPGQFAVNAEVQLDGFDLLLGESEGKTVLRVSGCFLPTDQLEPCNVNGRAINAYELDVKIVSEERRADGIIVLSPALVGVQAGRLSGSAQLINQHANGTTHPSEEIPWQIDISRPQLNYVVADGSSLGGFIDFIGSGFVGSQPGELTEVTIDGTFQPDGGGAPKTLQLNLVTEFDSSSRVRYILNEDDELGNLINLRKESGTVSARFGGQVAFQSASTPFDYIDGEFRVEPVRQIVYVHYTQGYRDALERLGMGVLEAQVREQVLIRARAIFDGIGLEFRETEPDDYRLYARVDITGIDPNGMGLIGYDNTPGKDVGNLRLNDQIGGVHAQTQQDGYPGYGGVFVESFLSFSKRPPPGIESNPGATEVFDELFASLRPDIGGDPAGEVDLRGFQLLRDGTRCPAARGQRQLIVQCAVYAMGNILGGTMAHEVAHSLGLADPEGMRFHNDRDMPNHLMDAGFDRPFAERANIQGQGPEFFCLENFEYLSEILPTPTRDPMVGRTSCF